MKKAAMRELTFSILLSVISVVVLTVLFLKAPEYRLLFGILLVVAVLVPVIEWYYSEA